MVRRLKSKNSPHTKHNKNVLLFLELISEKGWAHDFIFKW